MVFLEHLNVGVVRQAFLAYRREVGRLPSAAIQILLNLGRHSRGEGTRPADGLVCWNRVVCRVVVYATSVSGGSVYVEVGSL